MHRLRLLLPCLVLGWTLLLPALPARAVEAPYESRLVRLAEILGSLHYLRNLCGEHGSKWRDEMDAILKSDNPDPETKAKLIASFNRGYRSYSDVYRTCTASATAAIDRYMKEGAALSDDIVTRFGN
ncbi:MAG: TIGR02301 family protein [Rhizobiaceae bacterium]